MDGECKERVQDEHDELCEKVCKLEDFVDTNEAFLLLDSEDQQLLRCQLEVMLEYKLILRSRLNRCC